MGAYNEDQYTIASQLQKVLCEKGYSYRVENCGAYENVFEAMQRVVFHEGDVAIIWTGVNIYNGEMAVDLRRLYEENAAPAEWCLDSLGHLNYKMSKIIAEAFYHKMKACLKSGDRKTDGQNQPVLFKVDDYNDILGTYIKGVYLDRNFPEGEAAESKACIVVDLNMPPAEYVEAITRNGMERLTVFVPKGVTDARYTFQEYIAQLSAITADRENIKVVSGDMCVPYYNFFQSYYIGKELSEKQARLDAKIFAQCIAKPLGICCRYGYIKGTKNSKEILYHQILKEELPKYGVQYRELI